MKIKKINKEFLDLYYKNKLVAYEFDEENGKIYLTDTYRAFIINYEDFVFRFDLFRQCKLKHLLDDTNYIDGIITNEIYRDVNDLRLITDKDKLLNIKVNNKYLDLFDNPEVKIKDELSPILVYENGVLVGLILPIKEY